MVITKDKQIYTNNLCPNADFVGGDNYVVDEATEEGRLLAQKISENHPYFELVTEVRQVPILEEQPIIIKKTDDETGEEIEVDTGETEWVETGNYKEVEYVIDVVSTERPEPEPVIPVPTLEERLEMTEITILGLMDIIMGGGV